jgi:hypothetical protein
LRCIDLSDHNIADCSAGGASQSVFLKVSPRFVRRKEFKKARKIVHHGLGVLHEVRRRLSKANADEHGPDVLKVLTLLIAGLARREHVAFRPYTIFEQGSRRLMIFGGGRSIAAAEKAMRVIGKKCAKTLRPLTH